MHSGLLESITIIAASRTAAACADPAGNPGVWGQLATRIKTASKVINLVSIASRRGTCFVNCVTWYFDLHRR
jgi:hypothetical protein